MVQGEVAYIGEQVLLGVTGAYLLVAFALQLAYEPPTLAALRKHLHRCKRNLLNPAQCCCH